MNKVIALGFTILLFLVVALPGKAATDDVYISEGLNDNWHRPYYFGNHDFQNGMGSVRVGDSYTYAYDYSSEMRWLVPLNTVDTITNATLTLVANSSTTATLMTRIYGVRQSLSCDIAQTDAVYHDIILTTSYVEWNLTAWVVGTAYESPDLTTVIQEVLDQTPSDDDNWLCLVWKDPSVGYQGNNWHGAAAYEDITYTAPKLHIEWTPGATPTPTVSPTPTATIAAPTPTPWTLDENIPKFVDWTGHGVFFFLVVSCIILMGIFFRLGFITTFMMLWCGLILMYFVGVIALELILTVIFLTLAIITVKLFIVKGE